VSKGVFAVPTVFLIERIAPIGGHAAGRVASGRFARPTCCGGKTVTAKPPHPIDMRVGKRIRMWRAERKMSRIHLSEAIGLTLQQIQKYENGTNRIGASRLQQICTVLEIPVAFLFEGASGSSPGESSMPQDIIDFMESPEGVRFVVAFRSITDPKVRRSVSRLTNRIADGMQPEASAGVLQLKEPTEEPAGNT
jgi:transcriptional regulator with XRE-family HTH domain